MRLAYSFESDLAFKDAVKMFDAMEDWVHKPGLDGRWLVRDNDFWGDYLSYYARDESDRSVVKTICLFFDTRPRQVTLEVRRDEDAAAGGGNLKRIWRGHRSYVLKVLLPSIGARDVKPSDFER